MTTFRDLVDSIGSSLHSYTGVQETYTWLTGDINASTLSLPVADSSTVQRGIAEIDDELVFVDSSASNSLTLAPFGRGFRASTAASHTTNTQVLYDPSFPRSEVKRRINAVVAALYPQLYQIKTATFTGDGHTLNLDLPDMADQVISIQYQLPGDPTNDWTPILNFRYDPFNANAKTVLLTYPVTPAASIRVAYTCPFGTLNVDSDTLAAAGIPDSCADLIGYAVVAAMIRFLDPTRLQMTSVENISRSQVVQVGDASKIAAQFYAMYQQRLAEERRKLLTLTPANINFQD